MTPVRAHFTFYCNFLFSCSISLLFKGKDYVALIHQYIFSDQNFWLHRRIQKDLENELMFMRGEGLGGGIDWEFGIDMYILLYLK